MNKALSFRHAIFTVWLRHFAVFKKDLVYGMVTTFVEPILYLASFGFGLGRMIDHVEISGLKLSYRAFIFGGLLGQTILFTAFFDGAYGGFVRMYYQKIFQAIAVTPVTLSEVLWGELLWGSSRAMLPVIVVMGLGIALGDLHPLGCLIFLPLAFCSAVLFAALGMLTAALSKSIESINYPQYLFIFPMFLFCGVYFPLQQLPLSLQYFARVLPLTATLSLARYFTVGTLFEWWSPLVLIIWLTLLVFWARRAMMSRLVS
jgi:lipooligosaccharide transport system permease protein